MRILLTGYSGFIGSHLSSFLSQRGHTVSFLGRHTSPSFSEDFTKLVSLSDVIIHLSGAPIFPASPFVNYDEIWNSRIQPTQKLSDTILSSQKKPSLFISASATGFYQGAPQKQALLESDPPGSGFFAALCTAWESAAASAASEFTRCISLRLGLVLHPSGGVLKRLQWPFLAYLGGHLGNGKQRLPWIHLFDLLALIDFCIHTPSISGPVNAVSPEQISMKHMMQRYATSLNRPSYLHLPHSIVRLLFGKRADLLLEDLPVFPQKLIDSGFCFSHNSF